MAQITIDNDLLVVTIEGMDKAWTLQSRLTMPLRNVTAAALAMEAKGDLPSVFAKIVGTGVPGQFLGGTFLHDGGRVFCEFNPRHLERAVVIHLRDEKYRELVVEVDDPGAVIAAISAAQAGKK